MSKHKTWSEKEREDVAIDTACAFMSAVKWEREFEATFLSDRPSPEGAYFVDVRDTSDSTKSWTLHLYQDHIRGGRAYTEIFVRRHVKLLAGGGDLCRVRGGRHDGKTETNNF